MSPQTFAQSLLDRGIELIIRGNRLHVWPKQAYPYLTAEERDFLSAHRAELKAIAALGRETTVVWQPPRRDQQSAQSTPTPATPTPTPMPVECCPYCRKPLAECAEMRTSRPVVYAALHYDSPAFVLQRREFETRVMQQQIGKPLPDWYRY
jgi:hypothetical protein